MSDYDEFVKRMGSFDMELSVEDIEPPEDKPKRTKEEIIQHYGVKGMKWGVRRYQPYPKGSRNAGKFVDVQKSKGGPQITKDSGVVERTKAKIRSTGREMSMARASREIKNLKPESAKKAVSRAQLETRMKKLSSTKNVGDDQSKRDYLNRGSMDDDTLKTKVDTLQLAENMRQSARGSNRDAIDLGKKVATIAAPIAVQLINTKAIDTKWLKDKLNPVDPKNWDQIGSQAAQAVEKLI